MKIKKLEAGKLKSNISRTVNGEILANRVGGVEVMVRQNGIPCFEGVFGEKSPGEPLESGALYRIASMTKPITAAAFLMEVAAGRLRMDDRLGDYLPSFNHMQVADGSINRRDILMWHLLSHVSGIGCDFLGAEQFRDIPREEKRNLKAVTDAYSRLPLAFEPMTQAKYSPTAAFDCCARVIELVSGLSFHEYLKQRLFDPLGMTDTTFDPDSSQWKRMVSMFDVDEKGAPRVGKTYPGCVFEDLPPSYDCAGGGLASTASDYMRFAEMLLNNGKTPSGETLLPPDILAELYKPQTPASLTGKDERWGLGVRVVVGKRCTLPRGSFGWSGAFGTHFWVDPVNRITAVYMRNGLNSGGSDCGTAKQFEKDVMASFA